MICIFFFKQKTAYEMRISDWSSDVCSSDLQPGSLRQPQDNLQVAQTARRFLAIRLQGIRRVLVPGVTLLQLCPLCLEERLRIHLRAPGAGQGAQEKIGRASCRERVCQYV